MYRRVELGLSVACLALGIGVIIGAGFITRLQPPFEDPVGARGFAYFVGAFTALIAVLLIVAQVTAVRRGVTTFTEDEDPAITGDDPRYPASSRRAFVMVAITAAYALLLTLLGYLVATPVFVAVAMWAMGGRGRAKLVVFPIAFAVVSYGLFDTLLGVRLPPGILAPLLRLVGLE
jgi:hypothetical protein